MPGEGFDLEILHLILSHFSKDVATDCVKLIENLLKCGPESGLNNSSKPESRTVFASVKVLLSLYEKLDTDNIGLPITVILQKIKQLLHCNNKNCDLPDDDVQSSVLSIVSTLFKSVIKHNSQKDLEELTELYIYILSQLSETKECKFDCVIFQLKILNSIYHSLPQDNYIIENMKLRNNLDECELFADLIWHQNDSVAIQTLMYLTPEHINCFQSERVLEVTWKKVTHTATNSSSEYTRALIILCNIFDICFDKSKVKDKVDLTKLLLEDSKYWKLVQLALVERDTSKRKQGMFLLKKTVDLLNTTCRYFVCGEDNIFYWHMDFKDELQEIYSQIITCLEYLEEQQVHIIKPALEMVETLEKRIIECDTVNYSWVLLLYKKAILHESTQIIKWGVTKLLKLPENFFSHDYIARETAELLVDALKNIDLYYNNGLAVSRDLNDFLSRAIRFRSSKLFFRTFIKQICSQVWSAEALFFVIHSFSGIQQFPVWGEEELSDIGKFVLKAFQTHNKIIRTGVQCELLNAITTFTEHVPLECVIILISKFCTGEVIGTQALYDFTIWLRNSYSNKEADDVLEKHKKGETFSGKFLSLMLTLFHHVFYSDSENSPALNYLQDVMSLFKDIDKRLYCDKLLYDQYLSMVHCIYEADSYKLALSCKEGKVLPDMEGDNEIVVKFIGEECIYVEIENFATSITPLLRDILSYIQTQLEQISNLQDFNACESYLNSFGLFVRTIIREQAPTVRREVTTNFFHALLVYPFSRCPEYMNNLFAAVLKDTETCLSSNSGIPPIGIYWRIKLLRILLMMYMIGRNGKEAPRFSHSLLSYLREVNEPLTKDGDDSKKTRDLQTLWGKMNSQFIEEKWKILIVLIQGGIISRGPCSDEGTCSIEDEALVKLCLEALNSGGYGVLPYVMNVLKQVFVKLETCPEDRRVVDSLWKLIMERRKTEEFKFLIRLFVQLLYDEPFIRKGVSTQEVSFEYADLIFSDSSTGVVNTFMKHISTLSRFHERSVRLFCHVVAKGLMFGPAQRKDERLTNQVCQHIDSLRICGNKKIGDYNLCNEIRAAAVRMILELDRDSPQDQAAARKLISTLLKMEGDINRNRSRYFGNSHVHRVKHRLMQSLLLLESLLDPNENVAMELSSWLYHCLRTENSQPSVRYQQEWLLVRMFLRHSELCRRFSICEEFEGSNKRSLCSAIAVSYHLCRGSPSDVVEERLLTQMEDIFSFCFHQHFEVRLYSQVAFHNLYNFARDKELTKVTDKFHLINTCLSRIFETHLKGNFGKNLEKMLEDFYFTKFHPLEHYSLETIYEDLPRLTNVDSDEWISTGLFGTSRWKWCPLQSPNSDLKMFPQENKWEVGQPGDATTHGGNPSEVVVGNYQKKVIPQKPLIPGWNDDSTCQSEKIKEGSETGGLIVVASLIDRLPNLGGLARTCEIFGASEYVVGSLRYTEDKQFTSLSVTAEKWIKIKEVKAQNLMDYIFEMKSNGYTVIGAEQMLHSMPLGSAKFPKKSLLLLGNEKEGIPPNLLPLLDICIEIPQLGVIRSLNVHVTGALFIWEYAKQNHFL